MTKSNVFFGAVLALALFLSACSPSTHASLEGSRWRLVSLNGTSLEGSNPITIQFETNGLVGGSAGCNSYGGNYSANSDETILFSEIVQTEMSCMDETVMANELTFLQTLNGVNRYQIKGDMLTLSDDGQELVFERADS